MTNQASINDLGVAYPCEDLGKTMPAQLPKVITVAEHAAAFFCLDSCDVWTPDGWLVTAVQSDGVTHHLRKGTRRCRRVLSPESRLGYRPTERAIALGY